MSGAGEFVFVLMGWAVVLGILYMIGNGMWKALLCLVGAPLAAVYGTVLLWKVSAIAAAVFLFIMLACLPGLLLMGGD